MTLNKCICGAEGGTPFIAFERQFGMGDEFTYLECDVCGSLRIAAVPPDLSRYYPQSYYSFSGGPCGWRDRLQPLAMKFALTFRFPHLPWLHFPWASIVQNMGISRSHRVLDVGSGVQGMATHLRAAGHRYALGIDPFVRCDVQDGRGLAVKKAYLSEIGGQWDVIIFNASLEHMPDPLCELSIAKRSLSTKGCIIARTPVASWAYREYGTCWVQLDAPRHLFIPTERGFRHMADRIGLRVARVVYDSTEFQFRGSELYRRGIPLTAIRQDNYWQFTTRAERRRMMKRAQELNRRREGDQAAFFMM